MAEARSARIRIDKWLWYARFYKTRPLAQRAAESGLLRLNGARVTKPSAVVGPGDILTVPRGREVAAVRVTALGRRRGPAVEAQGLYEILTDSGLDPGAAAP